MSFEYRVKINCDHRTRSILTDAIYRKHKECNRIKHIVQYCTLESKIESKIELLFGVNEVKYIEKFLLKRNLRLIKCVHYNMAMYGI